MEPSQYFNITSSTIAETRRYVRIITDSCVVIDWLYDRRREVSATPDLGHTLRDAVANREPDDTVVSERLHKNASIHQYAFGSTPPPPHPNPTRAHHAGVVPARITLGAGSIQQCPSRRTYVITKHRGLTGYEMQERPGVTNICNTAVFVQDSANANPVDALLRRHAVYLVPLRDRAFHHQCRSESCKSFKWLRPIQ